MSLHVCQNSNYKCIGPLYLVYYNIALHTLVLMPYSVLKIGTLKKLYRMDNQIKDSQNANFYIFRRNLDGQVNSVQSSLNIKYLIANSTRGSNEVLRIWVQTN